MRRFLSITALMAVPLVLSSCSFGEPPEPEGGQPPDLPTPSSNPQDNPATLLTTVAEGLEVPWGLEFLPDGTALVGERDSGRLLAITLGEDGTTGEPAELLTIDDLDSTGEGGMLGLAVSPDYDQDSTVYLYYTTEDDNRIVALDLEADWESEETEPEPILTSIPSAQNHNGGALEFGPDGYLWASTGDAAVASNAQDEDSLSGKILRIDTEGEPAPDNPDPDSPVYSMGHRNIEGLAWDGNGQLYATEFGDAVADEINRIEPGGNYGWPVYEGPGGDPDYIDPVVTWEPFEASCAGAMFAEGALITACLRGQRLWVVEFDTSGNPAGDPQPTLAGEFGRLRSIAMGPDGMLWVTTSNLDGRCVEDRGCTTNEADDRVLRFATTYAAEGIVLCLNGSQRLGDVREPSRSRSGSGSEPSSNDCGPPEPPAGSP